MPARQRLPISSVNGVLWDAHARERRVSGWSAGRPVIAATRPCSAVICGAQGRSQLRHVAAPRSPERQSDQRWESATQTCHGALLI